jgi:hypothetical protein
VTTANPAWNLTVSVSKDGKLSANDSHNAVVRLGGSQSTWSNAFLVLATLHVGAACWLHSAVPPAAALRTLPTAAATHHLLVPMLEPLSSIGVHFDPPHHQRNWP